MIQDSHRSIFCTVVVFGALGVGFWQSSAHAQLAPWQQPPGATPSSPPGNAVQTADPASAAVNPSRDAAPGRASGDAANSAAPWTGEDNEQDGGPLGFRRGYLSGLAYDSIHDRFWARSEFLGWWTKGFASPPLLSTSPLGTDVTQAGVLGVSGTTLVFGGRDLGGGFHPGERLVFGAWLDQCQSLGAEASYLQINRQTKYFNSDGVSVPILARPFFNSETGQQDSQIIAYPDLQSGTFSAAAASSLQVAEVLVRKNLRNRPEFTVDLVGGYRFQQLDDHLVVNDTLTFSGTQSGFPAGSILQQSDRFDTRNMFQGGVLGVSTSLRHERWTIDTVLKIGIGQTQSRVIIEGATATTIPQQAATLLPGGLLALPSNMGVHDSDQFSVVPEIGIGVGFELSPQIRATVGYEVLYWNNVARPGDQIDLNVDPRQFPPPATTDATRPQFLLRTSDYWAQGLNLGLDVRF
jgi:hypothetical protein